MKLDLKELIAKLTKCDYIVEQGTDNTDSGNWTYRKWNSGVAECWGTRSTGSFSGTAVNGWFCRVLGDCLFPTGLFIEAPKVWANMDYWNTGYYWAGVRSVTKTAYSLNVINNSSASDTGQWSVHAIGKWK